MNGGSTTTRCRDCGAHILWARSETGKRIPVDHEPSAEGNLLLVSTENGKLLALAKRWIIANSRGGYSGQGYSSYGYFGQGEQHSSRYVPHHTTCLKSNERGNA